MNKTEDRLWEMPISMWMSLILVSGLIVFIFHDSLRELVRIWGEREEYSYGYLIPLISLFLVWQKKDELARVPFAGSWWGIPVTLLGFGLFTIGKLSTFYHVMQYSFLMVTAGVVLSFAGPRVTKIIWFPLALLLFMVPLPGFVLLKISSQLQLISSEIGVWFIRLLGISVFRDGNVIDLGSMKLQVVEACSGLRYLFPLMTLSFIAAYLFRVEFWKRAVVFLSSIPITIFMNSFRIGAIGVLVEYWGKAMAEGFLHDFEGWAVFMVCTGMLIAEMWILAKIGPIKSPFQEMFKLDFPEPRPKDAVTQPRPASRPFLAVVSIIVIVATLSTVVPQREQSLPPRKDFSSFPLNVGDWEGKPERLEQMYLDILKLDDYAIIDFLKRNHTDRQWINFYAAYYASQNKGSASHSPATCIPAGGWVINEISRYQVKDVRYNGNPLWVNRAVIRKDDTRQLVYYWFQERDRNITDDTMVSWYIFWDALTRNRTDGALVRFTTMVLPHEDLAVADKRLADFMKTIIEPLRSYIPN